eukprot:jgi/Mesen1/8228/ME000443S07378
MNLMADPGCHVSRFADGVGGEGRRKPDSKPLGVKPPPPSVVAVPPSAGLPVHPSLPHFSPPLSLALPTPQGCALCAPYGCSKNSKPLILAFRQAVHPGHLHSVGLFGLEGTVEASPGKRTGLDPALVDEAFLQRACRRPPPGTHSDASCEAERAAWICAGGVETIGRLSVQYLSIVAVFAEAAEGGENHHVDANHRAMVDQLLLSMSDVLLISYASSFGHVVNGLAGHNNTFFMNICENSGYTKASQFKYNNRTVCERVWGQESCNGFQQNLPCNNWQKYGTTDPRKWLGHVVACQDMQQGLSLVPIYE